MSCDKPKRDQETVQLSGEFIGSNVGLLRFGFFPTRTMAFKEQTQV